jgi:hypothetical protein
MQTQTINPMTRTLVVAAVILGLAAGSYGIANAASGTATTTSTGASAPPSSQSPPGASAQNPWGHQRSDEMLVTGSDLATAQAAALAKVPGGTIIRVESDADGNGQYEAHMLDASGNPVTVYFDAQFTVTSTQSR